MSPTNSNEVAQAKIGKKTIASMSFRQNYAV